jgi:nitroreductase
METAIDDLEWRYATKKFDPTRKLDIKTLETLLEVVRLSPSSYGLQPTKVLVVNQPELRNQLVQAAFGQKQVAEASHLLVLCSPQHLDESLIQSYVERIAAVREQSVESLSGFQNMLINFSNSKTQGELSEWMKKQNYIILGHLMQVCAQLRIDATPMEGFNAAEFDRILGLTERGLKTDLVLPVGYRHLEDPYLSRKKVRRERAQIVEIIE